MKCTSYLYDIKIKVMKLYTEEQVKDAYLQGWYDGQNDNIGYIDRVVDSLKPIELPSAEDIANKAEILFTLDEQESFIDGAKWMKEQILNQNK